MGTKRREQCSGKIRVETQILSQFWQTQEFCALICTAEPERGFTPVLDLERRINLLVNDISRVIIMNEFHILQIPGFRLWTVKGLGRHIVRNNIIVGVLLKHLNIIER